VAAVALAAIGVLYLTVATAHPPWIALALAASFGTYGLIRKVVKVESVPGLATETLLLAPFALALPRCGARRAASARSGTRARPSTRCWSAAG
jgi:RarD protein